MLEIYPGLIRDPPPRLAADRLRPLPSGREWKAEAARCMMELGGHASPQEAYAWFLREYPALKAGKGNWEFKVRVALQRAGQRICPTCMRVYQRPAWRKNEEWVTPTHECEWCGTKLPSVWYIRPELAVVYQQAPTPTPVEQAG